MVKRSRSQSTESPRRRIWPRIAPPDSAFHCQTRSTNFSRPRSWRDCPSAASCRSTTFWVAMPAWSMPGSQSASYPCIRLRRVSASCSVCSKAWPMCREPVTFGGGMTMVKGGLSLSADGREVPGRYPLLVPPLLYLAGLVLGRQLGGVGAWGIQAFGHP